MALAKRLVADKAWASRPACFGPEGEGWLRWCFASREPERLTRGVDQAGAGARAIISDSQPGTGSPFVRRVNKHGAGRLHLPPQVETSKPIPAAACPGGLAL